MDKYGKFQDPPMSEAALIVRQKKCQTSVHRFPFERSSIYFDRLTLENNEWADVMRRINDGSWKAQTESLIANDVEKILKDIHRPPPLDLASETQTLAEDALLQVSSLVFSTKGKA